MVILASLALQQATASFSLTDVQFMVIAVLCVVGLVVVLRWLYRLIWGKDCTWHPKK